MSNQQLWEKPKTVYTTRPPSTKDKILQLLMIIQATCYNYQTGSKNDVDKILEELIMLFRENYLITNKTKNDFSTLSKYIIALFNQKDDKSYKALCYHILKMGENVKLGNYPKKIKK